MKITKDISPQDRELLNKLRLNKDNCLHQMDEPTMSRLTQLSDTIELEKGEFLFTPGEKDTSLYITLEGNFKFWYWAENKEEIAFFTLVPSVFFNFHCTYGNEDSFFYCEACNHVRAIRLNKHNFDLLVKESMNFCHWNINWLLNQLYHFEMKMKLRAGSPKSQYESFCEKYPQLIRNLPLQDIASYLKITPQYLSKLRRN